MVLKPTPAYDERIEKFRLGLNRNYEYEYFAMDTKIAMRVPRDSVTNLNTDDIKGIMSAIKTTDIFHLKRVVLYVYIIADKDYSELRTNELIELLGDEWVCLEESIRKRAERGQTPIDTLSIQSREVLRHLESLAKSLTIYITEIETRKTAHSTISMIVKARPGRYVRYRSVPIGEEIPIDELAVAPTVKFSLLRTGGLVDGKIEIDREDIKKKVRRRGINVLIGIIADTSTSMGEIKKVSILKLLVRTLINLAYQRKTDIAIINCSGNEAKMAFPFTSATSVDAAIINFVDTVSFDGQTPLASALLMAYKALLERYVISRGDIPVLVLITDGTANVPMMPGADVKAELLWVAKLLKEAEIGLFVVDISDKGCDMIKEIAKGELGEYVHFTPGESVLEKIKEITKIKG